MADVKQTEMMVPFITCEVSFGQYVCDLVFGFNVFDLDFGVQIDSIKLLPLMIILITASLSSNTYNKAS